MNVEQSIGIILSFMTFIWDTKLVHEWQIDIPKVGARAVKKRDALG